MLNFFAIHNMYMAPTWSWSYGSRIYNYMYLCNLCLSPLKVVSSNPAQGKCARYNII